MPMLPTVKAVYWRAFSDIFTCQKLLYSSMQEKYRALTMLSMVSYIRGRGYESFLEVPEVNTEAKGAIFLPHQYHSITPR